MQDYVRIRTYVDPRVPRGLARPTYVDLGREAVASHFRAKVLTSVVVSDEFDDALTFSLVEAFVADGYKVFFMTSSGWISASQQLGRRYPDLYFVQNPGWDFGMTNVLGVDGALYQAYYVAGTLAGSMSQTKKLGFLNGEASIAVTQNSANAYCAGARSIDATITCHQIMLGNWVDPRRHVQGTNQLLAAGCDHIVSVTGSYLPGERVAELYHDTGQRIYSVGFADDFRVKVGASVVSSAVFYWDAPYIEIVGSYLAGNQLGGVLFSAMNTGGVDVAPPSDIVPPALLPGFEAERQRLLTAPLGMELVFCGPLALEGLPSDVTPDNTTGCLTQSQVSTMGYQMGYMQTTQPEFFWVDVYVTSGSAAFIAMIVSISVCVALSFFYLALLFYYLSTPVIRLASPVFCYVVFLGAYMQFAAAYIYLQEPTDGTCMAPYWLEMIGLTLMLSAILVKNYRMWRVVRSAQKFVAIQISSAELLVVIFLAMLGMLAILIPWQASDPYVPVTQQSSDLALDERYLFCGDTNEALWISLIWGYQLVFIFAGVVLAYLTRRLQGVFNESSNIALALYNIVVLELICLPLIYTFEQSQYEAITILLTLQPTYRAIATLTLLFGPKFWTAWRHPHKNVMPSSITLRGTTSSGSHSSHITQDSHQ